MSHSGRRSQTKLFYKRRFQFAFMDQYLNPFINTFFKNFINFYKFSIVHSESSNQVYFTNKYNFYINYKLLPDLKYLLSQFSYDIFNSKSSEFENQNLIEWDSNFNNLIQNFLSHDFYKHFNIQTNSMIRYPSLFRNKYLFTLASLHKKVIVFNFQHSNFFNFIFLNKNLVYIKYLNKLTSYFTSLNGFTYID